jgi:fumarylacetoacetase
VDESGEKTELGCLFEATEAGSTLGTLADGQTLQYLSDGDDIVLEGFCEDAQGIKLGFGQ